MDPAVENLVAWLRHRSDCAVEDGLDAAELERAEAETSVRFPPLWRAVLARAHPVATAGVAYPDWRLRDRSAAELVAAPAAGVLFDVARNGFWWPAWGSRPDDPDDAARAASLQLESVPRLVPIRGHWYTGSKDGDPVLSIVQTDLYRPARTVAELAATGSPADDRPIAVVPFWSDLHGWSQRGT